MSRKQGKSKSLYLMEIPAQIEFPPFPVPAQEDVDESDLVIETVQPTTSNKRRRIKDSTDSDTDLSDSSEGANKIFKIKFNVSSIDSCVPEKVP